VADYIGLKLIVSEIWLKCDNVDNTNS